MNDNASAGLERQTCIRKQWCGTEDRAESDLGAVFDKIRKDARRAERRLFWIDLRVRARLVAAEAFKLVVALTLAGATTVLLWALVAP